MRIGYDAKRAFINKSGLGNYSRTLLKGLQKYFPENEYLLYTPTIKRNLFSQDFTSTSFQVKLPKSKINKIFSSYWRTLNLSKFLLQDRVDLFHGLSNELPARIKDSGIKSVVTIHDLIFLRFPQFFTRIDKNIYKNKFKHACQTANCIIAVSNQTKEDIINFLHIKPSKIKVVYQGCANQFWLKVSENDKENIQKKYQLQKPFLLNVGTIEPRKNVKNLLYALLYMKNDINLVVIGKPTKYLNELQRIIKDKKLQKRIFFYHNIPNEDLPAINQLAAGCVYPSFFEGFGIPVLEALVSRIPVISSHSSCLKETGGDAVLYCNPNSPDEIACSIDKMLEDNTLRNEMIRKGFQQAKKFSTKITMKKVMDIYKSMC